MPPEENDKFAQRVQRLNRVVDDSILQPVFISTHVLMKATLWVVFMGAYALSAIAFYLWVLYTADSVVLNAPADIKEVIHTLLLSIELLILVPVPAVVGVVSYQTLLQIADPLVPNLEPSERQVMVAEHLLLGLLVTITGTTLLGELIIGDTEVELYIGGALIILSLSVFMFSRRNHGQAPHDKPSPKS